MRSFVFLLLSFHGLLLMAPTSSTNIRFHLQPPLLPLSADERLEHYRAIIAKDLLRHRGASDRRHSAIIIGSSGRRQARESSKVPDLMSNTSRFEMPMRNGMEYAGVGMYLVVVRLGTPALPFSLVLDTASTLTWINCRVRRRRGRHHAHLPGAKGKIWYRPALSSSWRRHKCSNPLCATLPFATTECPKRSSSCLYEYLYNDGTKTAGIYGQEKATVALYGGKMAKLPGLVIGCSTFAQGSAVGSHDGVLSLGNHDISFGAHAARRFGGRFSFCLLEGDSSPNASSYLTFGPNPAINATDDDGLTMETPLIFYDPQVDPTYGAAVTGITIDGELLPISQELWDQHSIIIDTGTTLTGFITPIYHALTSVLHERFAALPRVVDIDGFDFCYNWTANAAGSDTALVSIPKMVLHMKDGARLEPETKSYMLPEVVPGVSCLGFNHLKDGTSMIGNILMQEHLWEFDLINAKLRFKKSSCPN